MGDFVREELVDSMCSNATKQILILVQDHLPPQFVGYAEVTYETSKGQDDLLIAYSLKYSFSDGPLQLFSISRTLPKATLSKLDLGSIKFLFQVWTCKFANQAIDELGKLNAL